MGSCESRDPPTPVEKAKTLTAAFGRGDKGPFLDALADDCVLEAAPRPKVEGKAAITEMFGRVPPSMKAQASNHTESGPDQVTYDEMWFDVTIPGMIKPAGGGSYRHHQLQGREGRLDRLGAEVDRLGRHDLQRRPVDPGRRHRGLAFVLQGQTARAATEDDAEEREEEGAAAVGVWKHFRAVCFPFETQSGSLFTCFL